MFCLLVLVIASSTIFNKFKSSFHSQATTLNSTGYDLIMAFKPRKSSWQESNLVNADVENIQDVSLRSLTPFAVL